MIEKLYVHVVKKKLNSIKCYVLKNNSPSYPSPSPFPPWKFAFYMFSRNFLCAHKCENMYYAHDLSVYLYIYTIDPLPFMRLPHILLCLAFFKLWNCIKPFFISAHVDLLHSLWCLRWIYPKLSHKPPIDKYFSQTWFWSAIACPYSCPPSFSACCSKPLMVSPWVTCSFYLFTQVSFQIRSKRSLSAASRT